ncbi:MAG: DUF2934 domain-containing protein [Phycisphaeraceae bacterium]|nr:DUF2934 domain-containing protein [Phycisphaeraceae bacterium]
MAGKRKTTKSGTTAAASKTTAASSKAPTAAKAVKRPRATKPKAKMPEVVMTVSHDQIAKRAYEIWLAKGCPQGADHQNWAEAEAELNGKGR